LNIARHWISVTKLLLQVWNNVMSKRTTRKSNPFVDLLMELHVGCGTKSRHPRTYLAEIDHGTLSLAAGALQLITGSDATGPLLSEPFSRCPCRRIPGGQPCHPSLRRQCFCRPVVDNVMKWLNRRTKRRSR